MNAMADELVDDLDDAEVQDENIAPERGRRKRRISPTQRSLKYLRRQGCQLVAVVEKWNAFMHGGRGGRQDLFGCIDVLAIRDDQVICVQCCSNDVSAHIDKMAEATFKNPEAKTECLVLPALFAAGIKVFVHGWSKSRATGKYQLRQVELS